MVSRASFGVFKIELLPVKNDSETFIEQLLNEQGMTEIFQKDNLICTQIRGYLDPCGATILVAVCKLLG